MTGNDVLQMTLYMAAVLLLVKPLGAYMAKVFAERPNRVTRFGAPVERALYRLCGIRADEEMTWQRYAMAMLLFNLAGLLVLYLLQRVQGWLPLNPQQLGAVAPGLAMNTAISFASNTNWQAYAGESTMSYLTDMLGLTVQNFLSAATGIAILLAVIRGFTRRSARTVGNFWVDTTRATLYVLLPLSLLLALALVSQGVIQNLHPYVEAHLLQSTTQTVGNATTPLSTQTLPMGPAASQVAIKQLGTNGGGFFNANSAHPFENPNAWTNLLEIWLILVTGFALPIAFGHMIGRKHDGVALFAAMAVILGVALFASYAAEAANNPILVHAGVAAAPGNMVGKEVRFGIVQSTSFNVAATATSCGAVNSFLDSYTPLGGLVSLFLMQLGEVAPGGVGSGFYGMILFTLLAVFVAGLMVGRTPEYLGKRIESHEVKLTVLAVLIQTAFILLGTGGALLTKSGLGSLAAAGPHGLTEMLYGWTSATENNGSAFAGLAANTPLLNYGLGIAMLAGRFAVMIPVLAIGGSLAAKPILPRSAGSFPTDGLLFVSLLIGVVVIMGGLQFMPADTLGPLAEHTLMQSGKLF